MQTKQFDSLGVKATAQNVPTTVEEFDTNAKRSGACLDEAVNNVIYRSFLADFRALFCEAVETATEIVRKVKSVKKGDKDVEVWDETEGEYIRRVRTSKGWEDDNTELQRIADVVSQSPDLKFDASATERKATGPKKLPENYKVAALRIFTNGSQVKWAEKLGLTYAEEVGENEEAIAKVRNANLETLGWAIKKVEDEKRKKAVEVEYV